MKQQETSLDPFQVLTLSLPQLGLVEHSLEAILPALGSTNPTTSTPAAVPPDAHPVARTSLVTSTICKMVNWDDGAKYRLLLAIIGSMDVKTPNWSAVAEKMGDKYSAEAVR